MAAACVDAHEACRIVDDLELGTASAGASVDKLVGLDIDRAVLDAPESRVAVPTVQALAVEQRDPALVVRVIEWLPAASKAAAMSLTSLTMAGPSG